MTGRFRWMPLALAVAIALPPTASIGPSTREDDRAELAYLSNSSRVQLRPTIHRPRVKLGWQSREGQPEVDQSVESSETDDGRHASSMSGLIPPRELPSLIPIGPCRPEQGAACKPLPASLFYCLRC